MAYYQSINVWCSIDLRFLLLVHSNLENPAAVGKDFDLWELASGLAKLSHKVPPLCSSFQGALSFESSQKVEIHRIARALPSIFIKWTSFFGCAYLYEGVNAE